MLNLSLSTIVFKKFIVVLALTFRFIPKSLLMISFLLFAFTDAKLAHFFHSFLPFFLTSKNNHKIKLLKIWFYFLYLWRRLHEFNNLFPGIMLTLIFLSKDIFSFFHFEYIIIIRFRLYDTSKLKFFPIQFTDVPIVSLRIEPSSPVIENNNENVTLYCDVVSGNPTTLLRVQWFLDGNLLKELPICNGMIPIHKRMFPRINFKNLNSTHRWSRCW